MSPCGCLCQEALKIPEFPPGLWENGSPRGSTWMHADSAQEGWEEALELGAVAHTCDLSTQESEAGRSQEFKASLSYVMSSRPTRAL